VVTLLNQFKSILYRSYCEAPLGRMVAVGDEKALHLLQFEDHTALPEALERLQQKAKAKIISGHASSLISIQAELDLYFQGKLTTFNTPLALLGTSFHVATWQALTNISYGKTVSYKELAAVVGNERAYRAVANANGANQMVIVVPCHRVIATNGKLGGYSAGLERKQWLLAHERSVFKNS
jgi:AraC family transcriptional regulator, regulatory protein of adaptative response / methylated-DNA-[protein]-cysteine methyltransferase